MMRTCLLLMAVAGLLTVGSAWGVDIGGKYKIALTGNSYSFDANAPVVGVGGTTTMIVGQKQDGVIVIEIAPLGDLPRLQLTGRTAGDLLGAVGCNPHASGRGIIRGQVHADKQALSGVLFYPWGPVEDKPKPDEPKPPPKLYGVLELSWAAVRTDVATPLTDPGAEPKPPPDEPKPPPKIADLAALAGRWGADVLGQSFNFVTGQVKDSKSSATLTLTPKGDYLLLTLPADSGFGPGLQLPCRAAGNLIAGYQQASDDSAATVLFFAQIVKGGIAGRCVGPAIWDDTDIVHGAGVPINGLLCDRFGAVRFMGDQEGPGPKPEPPPPPKVDLAF